MFFASCFALLTCPSYQQVEIVLNTRSFAIPIQVQAERRNDIARINLFVSRDQGQKWVLVASITPATDSFRCQAPDDGSFWFSVQIVDKKGNKEPATMDDAPVGQRIRVDTREKVNVARPDAVDEEIKQLREQIKKLQERLEQLEKAKLLPTSIIRG